MSDIQREIDYLGGMTLLAEDTQIRPAAMSHVKPSEYRFYAERALKNAAAEVARLTQERDEAYAALAAVGVEHIEGEWCYTSENGEMPADSLADAVERMANLIDRDALATARADERRRIREAVEKMETHAIIPRTSGRAFVTIDREDVLALLGDA